MQTWRCDKFSIGILGLGAAGLLGIAVFIVGASFTLPPSDRAVGIAAMLFTALWLAGLGGFLGALCWVYLRTRMSVGEALVSFAVPTWHGSLPLPPMREFSFVPAQLGAVETRQEVRRRFGATVIRSALAVVTVAGERLLLYRCIPGKIGDLPLASIAAAVGAAIQQPVTNRGTVNVDSYRSPAAATWETPAMAPQQAAAAHSAAVRWARISLWIVVTLVLLRVLLRAIQYSSP